MSNISQIRGLVFKDKEEIDFEKELIAQKIKEIE